MLLEEFDAEKYERTIRGQGREEAACRVRAGGRKVEAYQFLKEYSWESES